MKTTVLILMSLLCTSMMSNSVSAVTPRKAEVSSENLCAPHDTLDAVGNMCIRAAKPSHPCPQEYYYRNTHNDCAKCAGKTTYNEQLKKCQ